MATQEKILVRVPKKEKKAHANSRGYKKGESF